MRMQEGTQKRQWLPYMALALAVFFLPSSCSKEGLGGSNGNPTTTGSSGPLSFSVDIEMIFAEKCFDCHDGQSEEAGLDLRTVDSILEGGESGAAIVRGQPAQSLILKQLGAGHPPAEAEPLSSRELALVRKWIAEGARY